VPRIPDSPPASNQKFTSIKLTWMTCVMSTGFTPFDKCVAFIIMNAINEKTRDWKLSDETIAALMGRPGAIRSVQRARRRLRAAGWITWKRTSDANVYSLRHDNVMAAMDEIMRSRRERRTKREATSESRPDTTPESSIHTRRTYSEERSLPRKKESASISNELRLRNAKLDEIALANDARRERGGDPERTLRLMRVIGGGRAP